MKQLSREVSVTYDSCQAKDVENFGFIIETQQLTWIVRDIWHGFFI